MLSSSSMATKYHGYMHVRSTSLPSTPHPLTAAVEEQLDKLRGWLEYSMSCSSSLSQVHQSEETLQSGFCGLTGMYECVEDLLQSQHTQQVLVHYRHEKLVDKLLDGSLRLVDVTSTTRDALLRMKECVQETQSTLRRTSCLRNETNYSYMLCRKKLHKEMQKFIGHLRDQEKHYAKPTDLVDKDADFVAIVRVLRNVEAITISVFETLLSLAPAPIKSLGGKPGSRWSLIPKLIQKRRIACEVEQNECNTTSTCAVKPCNVQNAQRQLHAMEASIRGLEEGLEGALRRLIKTRVCLLNILNN